MVIFHRYHADKSGMECIFVCLRVSGACLQCQSFLCVCINTMFCYHTEIPQKAYQTSWKCISDTTKSREVGMSHNPSSCSSSLSSSSLSVVLNLNFVPRCFQGAVSTAGTCGCTTPSSTCGSELLLWTKAAGDTRCVFCWERWGGRRVGGCLCATHWMSSS